MDNRLLLGGTVVKVDQTRHSPAGLPITRFVLEHRSQQTEAGIARETRCRIGVVAGGEQLSNLAASIAVGSSLRVSGFLARANNRLGESRLVLHAESIELLS